VTLPVERNKVLIRVENLADKEEDVKVVNVTCIATAMWQSANILGTTAMAEPSITETTLSANMALAEMLERKMKWRTVDDETRRGHKTSPSYGADPSTVQLEPQRIRQFKVDFNPKPASPNLFLQ
jgi:hypothetical protein